VAHQRGFISVVVVYAPANPSEVQDKEHFYDQLSSLMNAVPPHDELIIIGDFYAVSGTDRSGHDEIIGLFGSGTPVQDQPVQGEKETLDRRRQLYELMLNHQPASS